jgi:ABC-2 type transport system ATP-binding protein
LRRDLETVLEKHGGKIDAIGHPTTTLEDLFLRIVAQSKAHPGRRYLPQKPGQENVKSAEITDPTSHIKT